MYTIRRSIDIHFAHHIRGHMGPCINIHGHTWKFEVVMAAQELDAQGFIVDFKELQQKVLQPCYQLLDHSLAIGVETYQEIEPELEKLGEKLLSSRPEELPQSETTELGSVQLRYPGGLKTTVFPFNPTSERLAAWLYQWSNKVLKDERVWVKLARIYETLHPVESVAEYSNESNPT